MIIPGNAMYYIEKRADAFVVHQRTASSEFVRIQKFSALADARRYVKDSADETYVLYDANGDRIKEDGTPWA